MSRKVLLRSTAMAASVALIAGASFMALQPAQAAVVGGTTLIPAAGGIDTLIQANSSAPCAAPATRVRAIATGFGFPGGVNGQIVVSPTAVGFSTSAPMSLPLSNSFRIYAQNNGNTPLVGAYDVRIQCVNTLGTVIYDEFQNTMTWTTPGNSFANISSATYTSTPFVASVATTTALTVAPVGSADEGTSVALTATVDGGVTDPNAGTVEFFDGATSLGTSPVVAGVATKSVTTLPVGNRTLSAVFSGVSGFNASTSPNVSYTINDVIVATTTTLAVTGSPTQYQPITLDATVAPNNAVGTVEFRDGVTILATRPLVSGTAQFVTSSLAVGPHSLTAVFVPTNVNDFSGSTSAAQSITIGAPAGVQEFITTEIPAGALTISLKTGQDGTVVFPAVLDADGAKFRGTSQIDPVRVIDTRSGSIGWVASGQLTPFAQGAGPSIAAVNLGWTPKFNTVDFPTGVSNALMTVVPAALVAPANGVVPSASTWTRTLATSPAGSSVGTADLGADISLVAPTTTLPGSHTAVLTLTAI